MIDLLNLAFYFENLKLQGLAPIYDMLPMFYMPIRDEVVEREYMLKPLLGIEADILNQAKEMAKSYWKMVSENQSISLNLKKATQGTK